MQQIMHCSTLVAVTFASRSSSSETGIHAVPKAVWYCLGIVLGLLSVYMLCKCCAKITEEKIEDSSLISPKSRYYRSASLSARATHPNSQPQQDTVIFNRTADNFRVTSDNFRVTDSSGEFSEEFVNKFDDIEINSCDSVGRRTGEFEGGGECEEVKHSGVGPRGKSEAANRDEAKANKVVKPGQVGQNGVFLRKFCTINVADINADEENSTLF